MSYAIGFNDPHVVSTFKQLTFGASHSYDFMR